MSCIPGIMGIKLTKFPMMDTGLFAKTFNDTTLKNTWKEWSTTQWSSITSSSYGTKLAAVVYLWNILDFGFSTTSSTITTAIKRHLGFRFLPFKVLFVLDIGYLG